MELLLAAGVNPWAANAAGRTALEEAALAGNTGVVRTLESHAVYCGRVAAKVGGGVFGAGAGAGGRGLACIVGSSMRHLRTVFIVVNCTSLWKGRAGKMCLRRW